MPTPDPFLDDDDDDTDPKLELAYKGGYEAGRTSLIRSRYVLFSCEMYDTDGGWDDYIGAYPTLQEAIDNKPTANYFRWHIVDLQTFEIVERGFTQNP